MLRQDQKITPLEILRMYWKHRIKATLFFIGVVALSVIGVLLIPRKYESETVLYVHLGRESVGIDPTANTGQTISLNYAREGEIVSVFNLIQSRVVCERVVDKLTPAVVQEKHLEKTPLEAILAPVADWLAQFESSGDMVVREEAIKKLTKTLKFDNPKKSHLLTISYRSRSAELAQQVLSEYVAAAVKHHLDSHHNPNSYGFLEKQSLELEAEVVKVKEQLRDAKNAVNVGSIEGHREVLRSRLSELDKQLVENQQALASAENRAELLRGMVPSELLERDATSGATSGATSKSVDDMRNEFFKLQIREREIMAKYRADHPAVKVVQEQTKRALEQMNLQELLIEMSTANSMKSRCNSLKEQYQMTAEELRKLNESEVTIKELERKGEQLIETHLQAQKNLATARMNEALEKDRITNVVISQAPTLMGKPLSRNGLLIIGLGVIVGMLGATGIAFLSESADDHLNRPADFEAELGVPVLMTIPRVREPQVANT